MGFLAYNSWQRIVGHPTAPEKARGEGNAQYRIGGAGDPTELR